jgi:hypothetical protein
VVRRPVADGEGAVIGYQLVAAYGEAGDATRAAA